MRNREMMGAKRRTWYRNAMPVKSVEEAKTFLTPGSSAWPNVGSKKYFWPISQLMSSRVAATQGGASAAAGSSHGSRGGVVVSLVVAFTAAPLQSFRFGSSRLA